MPLLDLGEVEDDHVVHLVRRHLGEGHPHFRVVGGREGVFALIVAVGVVEVARDHHLPGDLHRVAVESGEEVDVFLGLVEHRAVVDHRRLVLAVGEDVARARKLLRAQAVDRLGVRDLGDPVALHHVAAHPRHARVRLVVHEDVAAVVGAVGEGHVRVVQVAVVVHPLALRGEEGLRLGQGALFEDAEALVGLAPAGRRAAVEHRHAHQLAHGGEAEDAQLARLARGPEAVIFVELAGRERDRVGRRAGRAGGGRRDAGGRAARHRQPCAARAEERRAPRRRAEQAAAADAAFSVPIRHGLSLSFGWDGSGSRGRGSPRRPRPSPAA